MREGGGEDHVTVAVEFEQTDDSSHPMANNEI